MHTNQSFNKIIVSSLVKARRENTSIKRSSGALGSANWKRIVTKRNFKESL